MGVVFEDGLAAIAAIEQVVKGLGILNAQFSWHGSKAKGEGRSVKCVIMYDRPLFRFMTDPFFVRRLRFLRFPRVPLSSLDLHRRNPPR